MCSSDLDPNYGKYISCDEGWWHLVMLCDRELAAVDPDYTVFQIKEKFGGLRYYYAPSNPDNSEKMNGIISKYERMCAMTCEKTGKHGYLMKKDLRYKTLHESFLDEGWAKVNP